MDEKCPRCNWPIVSRGEAGCTNGNCACLCQSYPACKCGAFDKESPEIAISVPAGTKAPLVETPAPVYREAQDVPFVPIREPLNSGQTFVMLHQPDGKKATVVYIGRDKGKAFDALIEMGKSGDALLSEITVVEE
jgi:hypothetical protein